jgi:hypothetical protein
MLVLTLTMMCFTASVYAEQNNLNSTYANIEQKFDSIHVSFPVSIKLVQGDEYKIQYSAVDSQLLKTVKFEIKDDILYITPTNFIYYHDMETLNPKNLKFRIMTPKPVNIGTRKGLKITYSNSKNDSGNSTY